MGVPPVKGRHCKPRETRRISRAITIAVIAFTALGGGTVLSAPANAAETHAVRISNSALNWAEAHAKGHWYSWGGAGPYTYDCSGLVMTSFAHVGVSLPHNTVAMIHSGKLIRVYYPQRGDLAFWGPISAPYHVEFVTKWYHMTFGAQQAGTRIWWHSWSGWYAPSSYWRIR